MSLALERKYVLAISHRFEGFVAKSGNLWNARCPFCGDSKNKRRKRFYIYQKDNHLYSFCHNCNWSSGIKKLLQQLDYKLYQEYCLEAFASRNEKFDSDPIYKSKVAIAYDPDPATEALRSLQKISQLPVEHRAKKYIQSRMIPNEMHTILRWCPSFAAWSNSIKPGQFSNEVVHLDSGRVIIPFFSADNKFFAYLGRSIDGSDPRYILIYLNHNIPLLYGMNNTQLNKKVIIFEGPIDSMFIPNSIALCGGNLSVISEIKGLSDFVICFDNEPRKIETRNKIEHAINLNYSVFIWPSYISYKDINECIMNGLSADYLIQLINDNTYKELEAKIKLDFWCKL